MQTNLDLAWLRSVGTSEWDGDPESPPAFIWEMYSTEQGDGKYGAHVKLTWYELGAFVTAKIVGFGPCMKCSIDIPSQLTTREEVLNLLKVLGGWSGSLITPQNESAHGH
jgi:hypothetical protein